MALLFLSSDFSFLTVELTLPYTCVAYPLALHIPIKLTEQPLKGTSPPPSHAPTKNRIMLSGTTGLWL